MEFLKDYEFDLNYHPGKVNVMADATNSSKGAVLNKIIKGYLVAKAFLKIG